MVPGHGVTVTESLDGADSRDRDWFLLDYQKDKDVPSALVGHIRGGLDELDADKAALLLFSGERLCLSVGRCPTCSFTLMVLSTPSSPLSPSLLPYPPSPPPPPSFLHLDSAFMW